MGFRSKKQIRMQLNRNSMKKILAQSPINWEKSAEISGYITFTNGRTAGFCSGNPQLYEGYGYKKILKQMIIYQNSLKTGKPFMKGFSGEDLIVKEIHIEKHVGPLANFPELKP